MSPAGAATSGSGEPATPDPPPTPARPRPFRELGDFTTVDRRTVYLASVAVLVGAVAAGVAFLLLRLIGLITNLAYYGRFSWSFVSPAGNHLGYLALAVPVVGGAIIGVMARFGSERIRGHGIPEALESILVNKSKIDPRVTVLKPVSAALSIGTGGPFGAEGPIIMTGGSLGSVWGQMLHLSAAERKTLLVAGAAGGMAATFNTPVAAVLIAVELLLFEWRPRSLIPVGVASGVATIVRWEFLGAGALFPLPESPMPTVPIIGGALLIGLVAGLVATVLTFAVYAFEDLYRKLPVHWMWWPVLGGLVIGIGGLVDPRVLGVGYGTIDLLLVGGLGVTAVVLLLATKAVVWTASLGSGTSGGVLAPLLMMGAAVGTLVGGVLPIASPTFWALISLGAILGGTMRVPFTGVVFALELTHDLNVLFPLFVACLAAEGVTVFTLRRSILTEKVARRRVHVAREYAVDPLEVTPVKAVMHTDLVRTPADLAVGEAARLSSGARNGHAGHLLVNADGVPGGILTRREVLTYLGAGGDAGAPVRGIASTSAETVAPDYPLRTAAALLSDRDREAILVVKEDDPLRVLGYVEREDIFRARALALQDEQERGRTLTIPPLTFPAPGGRVTAAARAWKARFGGHARKDVAQDDPEDLE